MIEVIIVTANVFPHLEFNLGHHLQLHREHDDVFDEPQEVRVGGEEGVEVDPKDSPHMLDSPLTMSLEQVGHVRCDASSIVMNQTVRELLVRVESICWDGCKRLLPFARGEAVFLAHVQGERFLEAVPYLMP